MIADEGLHFPTFAQQTDGMPTRLLLLADIDSAHTRKWAIALADKGLEVGIFSLRKSVSRWFIGHNNITAFDSQGADLSLFQGNSFSKAIYLKQIFPLRKIIRFFRPDIVHAHYATSYGLLGRFCGFHPFLLSAWGSDVMDFPQRGILHRILLRSNLKKADLVLATSPTIERYIHAILKRDVVITPFGVDGNLFFSQQLPRKFGEETIVIGTIKSLEPVYRIENIINAFAELRKRIPEQALHLLIAGDGTQRQVLEQKVNELGIANCATFLGKIEPSEVPYWHNQIDIFMNISAYESFGVSVLEAMACEVPVIVTDTGGLADLVDNGVHGFRVPLQPLSETVIAMQRLVENSALRRKMGRKGRERVLKSYSWQQNVDQMLKIYDHILRGRK